MSCIGGEFFSSPAAIPSTHAEAIGQTWPVPITPTARRRRSANTPEAGEIFQKISCGRNAFGGFGYLSGDLAGPCDVLRGQDGAQVRDQRFPGSAREASDGAHLQPSDHSPQIACSPNVERINVGTPARRPAAVVPPPPW